MEVVEPDLVITKVANTGAANIGDEITYTLTVGHTGASQAAAFDLVIEDLLDPLGLLGALHRGPLRLRNGPAE